jgi:Histidine kinase
MPLVVSLIVATLAVADQVSSRRLTEDALAEQVERHRQEQARRAVLEERSRIARELHDVVAHHMSMVAVQAETAPCRIKDLPDDGLRDFAAIGETARAALVEMRRLLGDGGGPPWVSGGDTACSACQSVSPCSAAPWRQGRTRAEPGRTGRAAAPRRAVRARPPRPVPGHPARRGQDGVRHGRRRLRGRRQAQLVAAALRRAVTVKRSRRGRTAPGPPGARGCRGSGAGPSAPRTRCCRARPGAPRPRR